MKDVDKRARQTVALTGLIILMDSYRRDPAYSTSRNRLFVMQTKAGVADAAMMRAASARGWQKDYVKRLVQAGILVHITSNGQDAYAPGNPSELEALIHDHEEPNYGLRLSQFIFPNEAGLPRELRSKPDDDDAETTDVLDGTAEVDEVVTVKGTDLGDLVRGLLDIDKNIAATYALLVEKESQGNSEVLPYLRNRQKELDKRLDALEAAINAQRVQDAATASTLARIDAATASVVAGMSVVGTKLSKIDAIGIPHVISGAVRECLGFTQGITLASFMRDSVAKFQTQSQAREVLAELRSKLKDLGAIGELSLTAMAVEEENERSAR